MEMLTINDLAKFVNAEIKKGNGAKKIMLSDDDEGNGYHGLYFAFTPTEKVFGGSYSPSLPYGVKGEELKDYVVLG